MASSSLALLLTIILWVSVEAASPGETLREIEMRLKTEGHQDVYLATDRDMHNWWNEYDILMANYRSMFADNVCTDPDMLNSTLAVIEAKLEKASNWRPSGRFCTTRTTGTSLAWRRCLASSWRINLIRWTGKANNWTKRSPRWLPPRPPSMPIPAPVSGTSGATGEFAAPPVEGVCHTGPGLLRRKLSMAVINAMEMRMKRKPAIRSPAPSTANGATGLSGPSVTWSAEMETSTAKGPTQSQPCSAGKNAQALVPRPCPATTCWS